jgi:DNA polymerase-3 subunit epsilon
MSLDFVAIDFETANSEWGSACAVGLTVIRGGRVTD